MRATLPTLLFAGIGLLAAGALWELDIYRRGAWPTVVTWVLMGAGLVMIIAGLITRRRE